jgi:hypothetical protein
MSRNIFLPPPEARIVAAISSPTMAGLCLCSWYCHLLHLSEITLKQRRRQMLPETDKRGGCSPTMVLSEARGLLLFRVIRGGIGFTQRLGAKHRSPTGLSHTHPRTRASQEPSGPPPARIAGDGTAGSPETLRPLAVSVSQRRSFLPSSTVSAQPRRSCVPA